MKYFIFCLYACLLIGLVSCKKGQSSAESDSPYTATRKGVRYQFHQKGKGKKPYRGDVVMMTRRISHIDGTTLESTYDSNLYFGHPINNTGKLAKHVDEIFIKSRGGDSLSIQLKAGLIYGKYFLPNELSPQDIVLWESKVLDVVSFSDYQKLMEKQDAKLAKQRLQDNQVALQAYIATHQLDAQKLPSGVYYSVKEAGRGPKPVAGDSVYLHYTLYRMDGEKADASYDRGKPFTFRVGTAEVIQGLDKSIRLLREGTKATLLIPSEKAYGAEQKGKQLPAYSNLRFEIELIKVKKQ